LAKECEIANDGEVLTESKASAHLGRRVEGLISQVHKAINTIKVDDIKVEERLVMVLHLFRASLSDCGALGKLIYEAKPHTQ